MTWLEVNDNDNIKQFDRITILEVSITNSEINLIEIPSVPRSASSSSSLFAGRSDLYAPRRTNKPRDEQAKIVLLTARRLFFGGNFHSLSLSSILDLSKKKQKKKRSTLAVLVQIARLRCVKYILMFRRRVFKGRPSIDR